MRDVDIVVWRFCLEAKVCSGHGASGSPPSFSVVQQSSLKLSCLGCHSTCHKSISSKSLFRVSIVPSTAHSGLFFIWSPPADKVDPKYGGQKHSARWTLHNPECRQPVQPTTWSPMVLPLWCPPSPSYFFPSCHLIGSDALWRAFELSSKEKKEILWVPVFSCCTSLVLHTRSHTHTQLACLCSVSGHLTWALLAHMGARLTPTACITLTIDPPLCLTKTLDWTVNLRVDFGFRGEKSEGVGVLPIQWLLSVCVSVCVCESLWGMTSAYGLILLRLLITQSAEAERQINRCLGKFSKFKRSQSNNVTFLVQWYPAFQEPTRQMMKS